MKTQCHREGLLAACQLVSAAIPAKDLKPILKNLKAVAGDGRWTLIATDLEVGIRLDVQGLQILEPGEAILPAARLVSILREARDAEVLIQADSDACTVSGTTSPVEFEMASEDPAQFPDFPEFTDERYHEISAGSLREMIRRKRHWIDTHPTVTLSRRRCHEIRAVNAGLQPHVEALRCAALDRIAPLAMSRRARDVLRSRAHPWCFFPEKTLRSFLLLETD